MSTNDSPEAVEVDLAVESSRENSKSKHFKYKVFFVLSVAVVILTIFVIVGSGLGTLYGHVTGWILPAVPVATFGLYFAFNRLSLWWWDRKKGTDTPRALLFLTGAYAIATSVTMYLLFIVGFILMHFDVALNPSVVAAKISGGRGYEGIGGFRELFLITAIAFACVLSYVVLAVSAAQVHRRFFGTLVAAKAPSTHEDRVGKLYNKYVRVHNRLTQGHGIVSWIVWVLIVSITTWILFGLSAVNLSG